MAEFVIRLADERGRLQEQVQTAASAEELRARFTQAGYYVYSVKARGLRARQKRIKLEGFLIFNQQFLTLIKAGVPAEGHIFATGPHGTGLGKGDAALDQWPALLETWLRAQGLLTVDKATVGMK